MSQSAAGSTSPRQYNSPKTKGSPSQQLPMIPLLKLKSYMPQSRTTTKTLQFEPKTVHYPQVGNLPSYSADLYCFNPGAGGQTNNRSIHQPSDLARAKITDSLGLAKADGGKLFLSPQHSLTNQEAIVAQQDSRRQRSPTITTSQSNASSNKGAKEVESTSRLDQQNNLSLTRRRKKIDSAIAIDRRNSSTTSSAALNTSQDTTIKRSEEKQSCENSCSRSNMTPSSLPLAQEYNYAEKHQQNNTSDDSDRDSSQQAISNLESSARHQNIAGFDSVGQDVSNPSDERLLHQATHNSDSQPTLQSASSPFMSSDLRQFKASEQSGNTSSNESNLTSGNSSSNNNNHRDNQITNPGTAIIGSSEYSSRQNLNHSGSGETSRPEIQAANIINNLPQNYQQSLATGDLATANNTGVPPFAHYTPSNQLGLYSHHHHQNFQASMLSQQIKLDNTSAAVAAARSLFDDSGSVGSNSLHIVQVSNYDAQVLTTNRNPSVQQHERSITGQYYDGSYTMKPAAAASKSSSPNSVDSSPSPKMSSMQVNTSHHPNHFITTTMANQSTTQTHLSHLSHHYMNTNANSINHDQHPQVNQHYNYGQQVTGASNQSHHLLISNHEQIYAHQQQQQHHQHQQQLQQHQHHPHHLQQQHHQQSQQQQSLPNQQSIYQQLANNAASVGVNHNYATANPGGHYSNHLHSSAMSGHQTNHLMSGAHQNHLNTAAAACAAAAVVSQTLKTVANQHGQQHQYGSSIANGFGATTGGLMNITSQHHQHLHNVNSLGDHHFVTQNSTSQNQHHQQQSNSTLSVSHGSSIAARKYQCKMCPQVFMSKAEMKYHNQNHMREAKPYKCLQCPKAFANSSYLSQHMRIHQGVKPYTCDICSRKFTQLSHLQQHKRTHTGDKPYKCNYMNCTKQFSQLSNLQSHSRCHQLDKPYKCNSCYKCFHDESSLLEHIPRHLESKHLKKNLCIFCGSSYQQERGLVKHFQQYHTDKTPTLVAAAIAAGTTGNTRLIASLVSSSQSNVFTAPSGGSSSSSTSSSCSIGSSGSLNGAYNNLASVHGQSTNFADPAGKVHY